MKINNCIKAVTRFKVKGLLSFNYSTWVGYLLLEEKSVKNEDSQLLSLTVPQYLFRAQRTPVFFFFLQFTQGLML